MGDYPERFREDSDIDLRVEGVAPRSFLRAECRLEELPDFPFDLVDIHEASPSLANVIQSEGEILYAAPE
ncbi:MAG: nucleotidyltransferase family protein [Syntrophothermus sp.]